MRASKDAEAVNPFASLAVTVTRLVASPPDPHCPLRLTVAPAMVTPHRLALLLNSVDITDQLYVIVPAPPDAVAVLLPMGPGPNDVFDGTLKVRLPPAIDTEKAGKLRVGELRVAPFKASPPELLHRIDLVASPIANSGEPAAVVPNQNPLVVLAGAVLPKLKKPPATTVTEVAKVLPRRP